MKELEKNEILLCAVRDKITGQFRFLTPKNNILEFIRDSVPIITAQYPLGDVQPYTVAIWNIENGQMSMCLEEHNWNEYEFPIDKISALAPLAKSSSQIKDAYDAQYSEIKDTLSKVVAMSKRLGLDS